MKVIKVPLRHYRPVMSGNGVGALFARLGRFVTPLLKSAFRAARPVARDTLKKLGQQGLETASATVTDALTDGISLKQAAKKNIKKSIPALKKTALTGVKRAATELAQANSIKRRKRGTGTHLRGAGKTRRKKKGKKTARTTRKKHQQKKKTKKRKIPYKGIFSG